MEIKPTEELSVLKVKKTKSQLAAEAEQKLIETKRNQRKFYLNRELAYGKENAEKTQKKVEDVVYENYFKFLQKEAEHQWKYLMFTSEIKDKYILELINEGHEYINRVKIIKQIRFDLVDEIICLFNEQLNTVTKRFDQLRDSYLNGRQNFFNSLHQRMSKNLAEMEENKTRLRNIIQEELDFTKYMANFQLDLYHQYYTTKVTSLQNAMENFVLCFWNNFKKVVANYEEGSIDQKIEIELMIEQQILKREIIDKFVVKVQAIKKQIAFYTKNTEGQRLKSEIELCEGERNFYQKHQKIIRNQFNALQKIDNNNLNKLSIISNDAIKEIEKQSCTIQLLLRDMNIAEKYETQDDNILPIDDEESVTLFPQNESFKDISFLHKFYYKRSIVAVQNEFLEKLLNEEKEESEKLKCLLATVVKNFRIKDLDKDFIIEMETACTDGHK